MQNSTQKNTSYLQIIWLLILLVKRNNVELITNIRRQIRLCRVEWEISIACAKSSSRWNLSHYYSRESAAINCLGWKLYRTHTRRNNRARRNTRPRPRSYKSSARATPSRNHHPPPPPWGLIESLEARNRRREQSAAIADNPNCSIAPINWRDLYRHPPPLSPLRQPSVHVGGMNRGRLSA